MELKFENQYPIAYDDKRKMIHITQVTTENRLKYYYCIACGEILVACAIGEGKKVVPYFRHLNKDNCTEDVIHVCCKNWLFVEGNKVTMIVNGVKKSFVCKYIEIEKRFETPFGEYIPDITITTKTDEQVFVEINHTSKKDETYCAKWEYLKSPVIEVSTKQLFESKFWNTSLELTAIFYDGVFTEDFHEKNSRDTYYNLKRDYIKSFSNIEYDKALCQKIFWFWEDTVRYNRGEISKEDFLDVFNALEMREMAYCTAFIESRKCLLIKDELSKICIDRFEEYCENYFKNDYLYNIFEIYIRKISTMRTEVYLKIRNNIETFSINTIESLILYKCLWRPKTYFDFIMKLERGEFEEVILKYYNNAMSDIEMQKQYKINVENYSSDDTVIDYIKKLNKTKFMKNYSFLVEHKNFINDIIYYDKENVDKTFFEYIESAIIKNENFIYDLDKAFTNYERQLRKDYKYGGGYEIAVETKEYLFIKRIIDDYNTRKLKKNKTLFIKEIERMILNNEINIKIDNLNDVLKKWSNVIVKETTIEDFVKYVKRKMFLHDIEILDILKRLNKKFCKNYCLELNSDYTVSYKHEYFKTVYFNIKNYFDVDDFNCNYIGLENYLIESIVDCDNKRIPNYIFSITENLSDMIKEKYNDIKLKIIVLNIGEAVSIRLSKNNNFISGSVIFYMENPIGYYTQRDVNYEIQIPVLKYTQEKIKIGMWNYFKDVLRRI